MFFHKKRGGFWSKKEYDMLDIGLIKLAVFACALFLASYIPQIIDVKLRWLWFVVFILAAIRPLSDFSNKK